MLRGEKNKSFFLILFCMFCVFVFLFNFISANEINGKNISLQSKQFAPEKGVSDSAKDLVGSRGQNNKTHLLAQFDHDLTKEEKEELKNNGVELLSYIPYNAWYISVDNKKFNNLEKSQNINFVDVIKTDYKKSKAVQEKNFGGWAFDRFGNVYLDVQFHKDVDFDLIKEKISKYSQIVAKDKEMKILTVLISSENIDFIVGMDEVEYVDEISAPIINEMDDAREIVNVNPVQVSPYNLNGKGITIFQYEIDSAFEHGDFNGRYKTPELFTARSNHATMVAGILIGNGSYNSEYRGIATKSEIVSYEEDTIPYLEIGWDYTSAINKNSADLASNSWGVGLASEIVSGGDEETLCEKYGDYDSSSHLLDKYVHEGTSLSKQIPIVFSVGNERQYYPYYGNLCSSNSYYPYYTINPPKSAKNIITVGAINSNDNSITYFTSYGPTDDGRLKPDLVAAGCQVGGDGGITSTVETNQYDSECGTSFAAPQVAGVSALILEQFEKNKPYDIEVPLPSTIKALLIHTAEDIENSGPDYQSGYGIMNATKAIDYAMYKYFREDDLSSSADEDEFNFYVDDTSEDVKVSLVWDDYPASAGSGIKLVNDLDLYLESPNGTIYSAWVLNPSSPSASATKGKNSLDNIEQVVAPAQIGEWTIIVNSTSCPECEQKYSLAYKRPWQVDLNEGWNLISIPFEPYNNSIEDVLLNKIYDELYFPSTVGIWSYEDSEWVFSDRDGFGNLDTISSGRGYWIKVNEDVSFEIYGDPSTINQESSTRAINLYSGWNLIGYNSFFEMDGDYVLDSGTNLEQFSKYVQGSEDDWDIYYDNVIYLNPDFNFNPGDAGWLYTGTSQNWSITPDRSPWPKREVIVLGSASSMSQPFTIFGEAVCDECLNRNNTNVIISLKDSNGTEILNYSMGDKYTDQYQLVVPTGGNLSENDTLQVFINGNPIAEGNITLGGASEFLALNISLSQTTDNDGDGFSSQCLDCNDNNSSINPNATEVCNGVDDNCNGFADEENALGCTVYYSDYDGDSYGDSYDSMCLCSSENNYTAIVGGDCVDYDEDIHPNVTEVCNDFYDNDCNGYSDCEDSACSEDVNCIESEVSLELVYPFGNLNVNQSEFFNVTLNVTCKKKDCGEINVSLDPQSIEDKSFKQNFNLQNKSERNITWEVVDKDYFGKFVNVEVERINDTDHIIRFELDKKFKKESMKCKNKECLEKMENFRIPFSKQSSVEEDFSELNKYPIKSKSFNVVTDENELDLINGIAELHVHSSGEVGEILEIGFGTITLTTVESGSSGRYASLGIDSNGVIHLAHWAGGVSYSFLRYCNNSNGSWSCEEVTNTTHYVYNGYGTALAVDSNDHIHIAFWNETDNNLGYCNNSLGSWGCETVDNTVASVGAYPSIAIDLEDNVHISYLEVTDENIKYANNIGGTWNIYDVVGQDNQYLDINNILINSTGGIYIFFQDDYYGDISYMISTDDGSSWTSGGDVISNTNYYDYGPISAQLDTNDKVHLVFDDDETNDLIYCNNVGGSFSCETIESQGDVGNYPNLALDENNYVHVIHTDSSNNDLRYCNNIVGWKCQVLDSSNSYPYKSYGGRSLEIKKGRLSSSSSFSNNMHFAYYDLGKLIYVNQTFLPLVDIIDPDFGDVLTSLPINLNFGISNETAISTCLYTLDNYITNTTIPNCTNTTFNTENGQHTLKLFVMDLNGSWSEDQVTFSVNSPIKYGLISTVIGDTPFYTNQSNPQIVNLSKDESQLVTFWVNATGIIDTTHKFFAFANLTSNINIGNITQEWNVTIVGPQSNQSSGTILFSDGAESWTHDSNCGSGNPWYSCSSSGSYIQSTDDAYMDPVNGSYFISMWDIDSGDEANSYLKQIEDTSGCDNLYLRFYTSTGSGNDGSSESCYVKASTDDSTYTKVFDSYTENGDTSWYDSSWHFKEVNINSYISSTTYLWFGGRPTFTKSASEWCNWDTIELICEDS